MSVPESYCVLPFIQLSVGSTGNVKNCCVSEGDHHKAGGETWNVGRDGLSEIWKSPDYEKLRAQFLAGEKPESCRRCFNDERLGIKSKRERDNEAWKQYYGIKEALPAPAWLDLRLGNLCNLKCRICDAHSSSKFAREAHELFKNFDLAKLQSETHWAEDENSDFWKTVDQWLAAVEHFDIYGGEPFLSKPHFAILEKSKNLGYSHAQSIHYNTNGTIFPEKMANEIWPYFKAVNVMFSIDGVGKQFEYQRHPAVWEQLEENIYKFKKYKNLNLNICFTVSNMNIWNFPEFHAWSRKVKLPFWINYLHNPEHFRVQLFSNPAKRLIEARLRKLPKDIQFKLQVEPLIEFLWDRSFSDADRSASLEQLAIYDRKRGESFQSVFPEAFTLMNMPEDELSRDAHP